MEDILNESDMAGLFQSVTEVSRAKPYHIDVGFEHRFRIWKDQILPGRIYEIQRECSVEFVHRMMNLLFSNGDTLTNRAIKEYKNDNIKMMSRIQAIDEILERETKSYLAEIDRIKLLKLNKEE